MKNHLKSNQDIVKHNLKAAEKGEGTLKFDKLILYLAPYCNLDCIGCYTNFDPQRTDERLRFYDEISGILDYAKSKGISELIIPGAGEPMMDPEFWKVVEYSHKIGLHAIVYTNGTMIDDKAAKKLLNWGIDIIIKLFSLDEKVHDGLTRTKGSHKLTLYGLNALLEAGYKEPRLALETYILKQNINDIPNLLAFCRKRDILPYFESFLLTVPSKKEEVKSMLVSDEELTALFKKLQKIDKTKLSIDTELYDGQRVYCSSPSQIYESPVCDIDGDKRCSRTYSTFSVMNSGDVRFCVVDYKTIGNIREMPLRGILSIKNPRVREVFHKPCNYSTAKYRGLK